MQQALAKVGIKPTIKAFPTGDYFTLYAGKPDYVKSNNLGLIINGWGADWPDGFGFLQPDRRTAARSAPAAATTTVELNDPAIDALIDKAHVRDRPGHEPAGVDRVDKKVMDGALRPADRVRPRACYYRPPTTDERLRQPGVRHVRLLSLGVKQVVVPVRRTREGR